MSESLSDNLRSLAVSGHPAHLMLIHGTVCDLKPEVVVLTDGSGGEGLAQIGYVRQVMSDIGASLNDMCGVGPDADFYAAIMQRDFGFYAELLDGIASVVQAVKPDLILVDPIEYFNPVHDITNIMVDLALLPMDAANRPLKLTYDLETKGFLETLPVHNRRILEDKEFEAKLDALRAFEEIKDDKQRWEDAGRIDWLRTETLYRDEMRGGHYPMPDEMPFYEAFGRQRVAEGRYHEALTYADHMIPLVDALGSHIRVRAA